MNRAIPAPAFDEEPARPVDWLWVTAIGLLVVASAAGTTWWWIGVGNRTPDWNVFAQIPVRLHAGTLFAPPAYNWRWSPVAAWIMLPIVSAGYLPFAMAHLAVLPLLRWRLALIAVLSWPFWADALASNTITFSVVAGVMALRGSRWAAILYITLLMLAPRPLLFPLAAYLLIHDRSIWIPTTGIIVVHTALLLASGYGGTYFLTLVEATNDVTNGWNFSPSRLVGIWWMVIGVPAAVVLTMRGWVGVASLAISPYLLPQYFLVALLDGPTMLRSRR